MPRPRKAEAVIPTTSLVASAQRMPGRMPRIYVPKQDWQVECYRHYAICGEARYAAQFFGNAMSRAVLSGGKIGRDGKVAKETEGGKVTDVLSGLFSGAEGQKQMLSAIGVHLTVAGECYLIGRTVDNIDVWEILSPLEVTKNGDSWTIKPSTGTTDIALTEEDVVIRIWLPHPAKRMEADSPFRALLPILSEIEWLTRHVFAQISSRLAGAGILMMPQEMTFPPAPEQDGVAQDTTNQANQFMLTLADAMETPINDPGSPAAMIPIVVTAPGDMIDKPRLLQFWSALDAESKELRSEAIRRFATGMSLPAEDILGMSSNGGTGGGTSNGVSHWGAWQIEESTIKMHIEPMLDMVVNALTMGYLRPAMNDDPTVVVVYDTATLRLRPDRSKEAFELYDRGLLKAVRLLEENGFSADDMPDDNEFRRWLLVKVASGSNTPEQVAEAANQLGVMIPVATVEQITEAPSDRSLDEHPERRATPDSALVAASEALVFRALERAGNRLRQKGMAPAGVPSYETHKYVQVNGSADALMVDAWPTAEKVLMGIADHKTVVPILDSYCRTLLAEQSCHDRDRLVVWLEAVK